jgi:hypothetical protein
MAGYYNFICKTPTNLLFQVGMILRYLQPITLTYCARGRLVVERLIPVNLSLTPLNPRIEESFPRLIPRFRPYFPAVLCDDFLLVFLTRLIPQCAGPG